MAPFQATGTKRAEATPCCCARPGTIASLVSASRTASALPVRRTVAVPEGPSLKRRKSLVSPGSLDAPRWSWLISSRRARSAPIRAFSAACSAAKSGPLVVAEAAW